MKHELSQLKQLNPSLVHADILYVYDNEEQYINQLADAVQLSREDGMPFVLLDTTAHYEQLKTLGDWSVQGKFSLEFYHVNSIVNCEFSEQSTDSYFTLFSRLLNSLHFFRTWIYFPNMNMASMDDDRQLQIVTLFLQANRQLLKFRDHWFVVVLSEQSTSASLQNRLKRDFNIFMTDNDFVHSDLYAPSACQAHVTSFKQATRTLYNRLKPYMNQWQTFIANSANPILILDESDRIVSVNAAYVKLFQWPPEQLLGLSEASMPSISEDRRFEIHRDRSFALSGRPVEPYRTKRLKKDGTWVNVTVCSFPLRDKAMQLCGRGVILHDMTESDHALAEFLETEQLAVAGQLADSIARELLQPITAIKGFTQLLEQEQSGNEDYFSVIHTEIDRIVGILREMLAFSQPKEHLSVMEELPAVLDEVIALMRPQALLNHVTIIRHYAEGSFPIIGDRNQLKQAFINYVKNAIEAMPQGGKLRIDCERQSSQLFCIRFVDQGTGIPKQLLREIGRPFFTTKKNGTGLGFMISRKMMEANGATVHIDSKEHVGTTIEICFHSATAFANR
ncbi:MAG: ATP-binding protein [Sporolactobacillus sp.]